MHGLALLALQALYGPTFSFDITRAVPCWDELFLNTRALIKEFAFTYFDVGPQPSIQVD